jgi:hypothetical protein
VAGEQSVDPVGEGGLLTAARHGADRIKVVEDMFRLALDVVGRALFGSDLTGAAGRVSDAMTVLLAKFRETQTMQWLITRHIPGRIRAVMTPVTTCSRWWLTSSRPPSGVGRRSGVPRRAVDADRRR